MARTEMKERSIATLTREIQEARREWDAAIAGLDVQEIRSAEITSAWSLKDVLAHLAAYLELNVRHIRSYKKRKQLASLRARNWYQFNKREAARAKNTPLSQLRRRFSQAYKELLTEIQTLTDADLDPLFPSPWSANETRRVRLGTVLRADVSSHLREHARDVLKWRKTRNDN